LKIIHALIAESILMLWAKSYQNLQFG